MGDVPPPRMSYRRRRASGVVRLHRHRNRLHGFPRRYIRRHHHNHRCRRRNRHRFRSCYRRRSYSTRTNPRPRRG